MNGMFWKEPQGSRITAGPLGCYLDSVLAIHPEGVHTVFSVLQQTRKAVVQPRLT